MNGDLSSATESASWEEFCNSRAETASENFVKDFLDFQRVNTGCRVNDPIQYARKFVDYFLKYFDEKVKRSSYYQDTNRTLPNPGLQPHRLSPQISLHDDYSDDTQVPQSNISRNGDTSKSVKSPHRKKGGLLRKFSLRGVRKKGKHQVEDANNEQLPQDNKKHKQVNPQHKHEKLQKQSKSLETHVQENCVKEGIVNVLTGEDAKGKSRWEKTRLMLVTKEGGSSLEFYSPPKVMCDIYVNW